MTDHLVTGAAQLRFDWISIILMLLKPELMSYYVVGLRADVQGTS